MDIDNFAIGIDIEQISRFENKTLESEASFLNLIYTKKELDYCFSKKKFAQHLAARFCAKEATIKALSSFQITNISLNEIEITNEKSGMPILTIKDHPEFQTRVSLSHTKTCAIANVLLIKSNS